MLSAGGDLTISQTDYLNMEPGGGIKGSAEYFFPTSSVHSFGLKLYAGREFLYGRDKNKIPDYFRTNMFLFGSGATYALQADRQLFPFASAGVSMLALKTEGIGEKKLKSDPPAHYGLGLDGNLGIHFVLGRSFILTLTGGYHFITDDLLDGVETGKYNDFYVTGSVGISYAISFGRRYKKAVPKSPEIKPVPKNQPPAVAAEKIPEEYKPIRINISNNLDSLVKGIRRIEKLSDIPSVRDTAINYRELNLVYNEKKEPEKEETGAANAPKRIVKEKAAPPVLPVKKKEAEKNTAKAGNASLAGPARTKPDANLPKEILLHGELTFVRGEATIQPEAYSRLDEIARTIKANPGVKWKIEAYTDNQGNEKELQQFTRKRAQAIMKYLTSKGISASQLQASGEGSKNPVEDNENVWGRMMNRRVIIKRLN